MTKHKLFITILLLFLGIYASAQDEPRRLQTLNGRTPINNNQSGFGDYSEQGNYYDEAGNRTTWGRDSTKHGKQKKIPVGMFQWILEPRLGTIIDAENNDTVVHNFQNFNNTDGYTGEYSYLGNTGTPRYDRIYMNRADDSDVFLFLRPLSYFRSGGLQEFRFTNTLSPITNLAYHSVGSKINGEDRVRANFATNINKDAGLGFKIDYLYGRGYFQNSACSSFGITFYTYYRGDRYNIHAYANVNHLKMFENGGIENDSYIREPEKLEQNYSTTDIPVLLSDTWNRNHEKNFYLTHKFNFGFYRDIEVPDSLKPQVPSPSELLSDLPDSIRLALRTDTLARRHALDSLTAKWQSEQIVPKEFIPVSSIIHTFDMRDLAHTYIAKSTSGTYYTNNYYGVLNNVYDMTGAMSIRNTFGLALREGFNKWAAMGITLFATHNIRTYKLLIDNEQGMEMQRYNENDLSIGGELARTQGKLLHFNVNAEFFLTGKKVGDLTVDGRTNWEFRLGKRDSLLFDVRAMIKNEKPDFFFRHYHSQHAWWDNDDLARQLRTRIEGTLRLKKFGTCLKFGFENISNYTYFAMQNTLLDETKPALPTNLSHAVTVNQHNGSVQVLGASIAQEMKYGLLHWENEVAFQTSTNQDVLPLPTINIYTNMYLLFRIAKILRIQVGADMRYFTKYYGLDYSPSIQQFAVQDANLERQKMGSQPIINVYLNTHLKHFRFYFMAQRVTGGKNAFYAPYYGMNPLTMCIGLSWNFIN
ncbi:MAG: putative porin [Bacteroidaceae bacterium]|nr:putative porin [Bacteroidaceae bacterium]